MASISESQSPAFQFFVALYKAGRSLNDYLNPLLETDFNMTLRDYIMLSSIFRGIHYPTKLADTLNMPKDMVSRHVNTLLSNELIQRSIDPQDSRRTRLEISAKGLETRTQMRAAIQATIDPILEQLGTAASQQLIASLDGFAELVSAQLIEPNPISQATQEA